LKLPGFDGDTLVCPVGSNDTADWKPAIAYPPFKKALLEAPVAVAAQSSLMPMPVISPLAPMPVSALSVPTIAPLAPRPLPPAPVVPPVKTVPCPGCAHANLEAARFCNSCGAHMNGRREEPAPAPAAAPTPPPFPAPDIFPAPATAPDPFAHLDPLLSFPTEPAPMTESPRRPLQPGKMGQLAALETSAPAVYEPLPSPAPAHAAEVPAIWKRPGVLPALTVAAIVASGLAYMALNKTAAVEPVAELTPLASTPMPETTPAPQVYTPPPTTSSPAMPAPRSFKPKKLSNFGGQLPAGSSIAATAPKRARKSRPIRAPKVEPPAGGGDTFIESRAPEPKARKKRAAKTAPAQTNDDGEDPLLEALLTNATETSAEAGGKALPTIGQRPTAKPSQFSLPGLSRPVSASDRTPGPGPIAEESSSTQIAGLDTPALNEPGKSTPPPGIENEPVKSAEGDQLALVQVHEQFDFCAQLLAQGAFGDHYDTCLCKDAREAAPYRGRRGFYVTAKKKEAASGKLESTAKILSSKIDNGVAKVTARWTAGGGDKGRNATQDWKLEDGLWCQAP